MNTNLQNAVPQIESTLRGFADAMPSDFVGLLVALLCAMVVAAVVIKVAGKAIKLAVLLVGLFVVVVIFFEFDPFGVGSHVREVLNNLTNR
jgi:uncharacterized membrane protein (Fun14 family)